MRRGVGGAPPRAMRSGSGFLGLGLDWGRSGISEPGRCIATRARRSAACAHPKSAERAASAFWARPPLLRLFAMQARKKQGEGKGKVERGGAKLSGLDYSDVGPEDARRLPNADIFVVRGAPRGLAQRSPIQTCTFSCYASLTSAWVR